MVNQASRLQVWIGNRNAGAVHDLADHRRLAECARQRRERGGEAPVEPGVETLLRRHAPDGRREGWRGRQGIGPVLEQPARLAIVRASWRRSRGTMAASRRRRAPAIRACRSRRPRVLETPTPARGTGRLRLPASQCPSACQASSASPNPNSGKSASVASTSWSVRTQPHHSSPQS